MSSPLITIPLPTVFPLENNNAHYLIWGPLIDAESANTTPIFVSDLALTATLYRNRDITDPDTTPGTVVAAFGTAGVIPVPYSGNNGIYIGNIAAADFGPIGNNYVLVIDAPLSPTGYQGHWEKSINLVTRQQ